MVYIDTEATGRQIRDLRNECDLSMLNMSEMLGVTFQAVYKWEKGICLPDIANLVMLARILKTTDDDILVVRYEEPGQSERMLI